MNSILPVLNDNELKDLLHKYTTNLRSLFGKHLNDVILYGSYARNEATEGSDIDLMILVDLPEDEINKYDDKISDFSTEVLLEKSILVSAIMHNKTIFDERTTFIPFYENVLKEGIKVCDA